MLKWPDKPTNLISIYNISLYTALCHSQILTYLLHTKSHATSNSLAFLVDNHYHGNTTCVNLAMLSLPNKCEKVCTVAMYQERQHLNMLSRWLWEQNKNMVTVKLSPWKLYMGTFSLFVYHEKPWGTCVLNLKLHYVDKTIILTLVHVKGHLMKLFSTQVFPNRK